MNTTFLRNSDKGFLKKIDYYLPREYIFVIAANSAKFFKLFNHKLAFQVKKFIVLRFFIFSSGFQAEIINSPKYITNYFSLASILETYDEFRYFRNFFPNLSFKIFYLYIKVCTMITTTTRIEDYLHINRC